MLSAAGSLGALGIFGPRLLSLNWEDYGRLWKIPNMNSRHHQSCSENLARVR